MNATTFILAADAPPIRFPAWVSPLTDDQFFDFCQLNPDSKFERHADGTIITMSLTGGESGERNSEITLELGLWNRQARSGHVYDSSTGFKLPNGAVRSPDAAWVSNAVWNALTPWQGKRYMPVCPEFVIELVSETDRLTDSAEKMEEYIENGCLLGWLINPKTETARVYRPDGSISLVHGFDNVLSGDAVLPGLVLDLSVLR